MNEQLQGKLVEILSNLQEATKTRGDFPIEQLPDVLQQYLLYGRVTSSVWLAGSLAATLVFSFLLKKAIARWRDTEEDQWVLLSLLAGVGCITSIGFTLGTLATSLMIWLAPKVWLLKEISKLVS